MAQPKRKQVLLVDDAVLVRKLVSRALAEDPALEVSATAVNGRVALAKFAAMKPDIVLLDIEMPEMDGLEAVRELRKLDAHVPIIMFGSLTESGASVILEALALGATDYVTKPSTIEGSDNAGTVARELIPKIRALCRLPVSSSALIATKPLAAAATASARSRIFLPAKIVVIGVSTGGPDALARLIPLLPAELPVPVLIAQHMPAIFTAMLASRLSQQNALPVRECRSGEPVAPGCAVLAPGDFHMEVQQENGSLVLKTHQGPRENFCRPSVDVLFRSVGHLYGERALAVVLTGMGQDGLRGCETLRAAGSRIYVQDEASSVVWGMPGFVARAGLADKILPIDQIAFEIVRATSLQAAAKTQ